ncbi:MAG: hypothetical protein EOL88_11385 [Bacteroidia bacterium]|nr:hypothetical protein [Bacteroidia bacterium]
MQTLRGVYKNGNIELLRKPDHKIGQMAVLITFLEDDQNVDLIEHGINETEAGDLRHRLQCFSDDWNQPEMDIYDDL